MTLAAGSEDLYEILGRAYVCETVVVVFVVVFFVARAVDLPNY